MDVTIYVSQKLDGMLWSFPCNPFKSVKSVVNKVGRTYFMFEVRGDC